MMLNIIHLRRQLDVNTVLVTAADLPSRIVSVPRGLNVQVTGLLLHSTAGQRRRCHFRDTILRCDDLEKNSKTGRIYLTLFLYSVRVEHNINVDKKRLPSLPSPKSTVLPSTLHVNFQQKMFFPQRRCRGLRSGEDQVVMLSRIHRLSWFCTWHKHLTPSPLCMSHPSKMWFIVVCMNL